MSARVFAVFGVAALMVVGFGTVPVGFAAIPATDWPMFHHDQTHSGISTDNTLTASNVAGLGVDWVANAGAPAYTSPAIAFNAQLGKTVVYVGNQSGVLSAYNASTGDRLWYYKSPSAIQSSAAVDGNVVYFGSTDHNLYALNAATGQKICAFNSGGNISASPVVVNPDGTGKVIYVGDNGLTGGSDGGNFWAINAVDPNPAVDCSMKWQFNGFAAANSGSWSPPAFAADSSGRPLIVFGSSDPDDSAYALDAVTGVKVWSYVGPAGPDADFGAGITISLPGVNGFANGEAYSTSKHRDIFANNLKTGALSWTFSARLDSPTATASLRSTPALVGNNLLFGYGAGVYDLNATTGAKIWKTQDVGPTIPEVVSSPAVSGPAGNQVFFVGDMGGSVRAFSMTGSQLWSYNTGAFIYSSPAIANGHMYVGSSNGLLYAFHLGGGVSGKPSSVITSPANGSTVTNTGAPVQVSGTAADDLGVAKVYIGVKNTATGRWWDSVSATWSNVFQASQAALGTPGGKSTTWSTSFPAPADGGVFLVQSDAVDTDGQHDPNLPISKFTLTSLSSPPDTTITSPQFRQVIHPPCCDPGGLFFMPYYVQITGTAVDTAGAHPGVKQVQVSVRNIQHGEYWCGSGGCPGEPGVYWRPAFTSVLATLSAPGATSTNWNTQFLIYDHEHSYRIVAWATDNDGIADPIRASLGRVCVNWPTNNTCL
jgi:outer membrane protein assembly factor BamB